MVPSEGTKEKCVLLVVCDRPTVQLKAFSHQNLTGTASVPVNLRHKVEKSHVPSSAPLPTKIGTQQCSHICLAAVIDMEA